MNALSTITAAVAAAIDGATFTTPPDLVERVFVPDYGTEDSRLVIQVCGLQETPDINGESSNRFECEHDYTVKAVIFKRVNAGNVTRSDPTTMAELDGLSDLREQLLDFLKNTRGMGDAFLKELTNAPVYDPVALDTRGVFASVITITYRMLR